MNNIVIKSWARAQNYGRAWRSPEKILVIESDDWGAIRTSSKEAYQNLVQHGYAMNRSCWGADALETDDDLIALYEVLNSFKDSRGCSACMTANMVMANPDFRAIRTSGFREYCFEPVRVTLERSLNRKAVSHLWQMGMANKIFRPQFHAREHIRWWEWIAALQQRSAEALETFDLGMCGVPAIVSKEHQSFFQPIYIDVSRIENSPVDLVRMIGGGIQLFEEQFGFRSMSTIAPNCAWTDNVEQIWAEYGIKYIQGGYCQRYIKGKRERLIPHYLSQKTRNNGWYLVRNCTFEPVKDEQTNSSEDCLAQIDCAFKSHMPAIVSSHRVNYIGSIKESNREKGLAALKQLLEELTCRWPETQFISSPELGFMIEHSLQFVGDLSGKEKEIFPGTLQGLTSESIKGKNDEVGE